MEHHFGFPLETTLIFFSLVLFFVWLDLRLHRSGQEITMGNAIGWSIFWVVLALGFYGYLRVRFSSEYASLFLAGYVLEKSLSVDNLMYSWRSSPRSASRTPCNTASCTSASSAPSSFA